jgi:Bardet-Biedl syndrome 1 protein
MDALKKDSEDSDGISLLVVGTEAGQILILPQDPLQSQVLCKVNIPGVPALLSVQGMFDVEWRVNVICRDGKMYVVKNGGMSAC